VIQWYDPSSLATFVLLPVLACFILWANRRRQLALTAFVANPLWATVVPDLNPRRRAARHAAFIGAIFCLMVALGGPMWGSKSEDVQREGIDLVVALDTSGSMLATDVKPSRLVRAKLALQTILAELRDDRIGLVAFAGTAFVQCPLTFDYSAVVESLEAIEVGIIPKGGTALSAAIDASLTAFEGREGKHQAVLLISDGEDHEGMVDAAVKRAVVRGLRIYTVGVGTREGDFVPGNSGDLLKDPSGRLVKSRLGERNLKMIAVETGGVYVRGTGPSLGLPGLYHDYIDTLQKRRLATRRERHLEHRFQVPLSLALALLAVESLIGERCADVRRSRRWLRVAPRVEGGS